MSGEGPDVDDPERVEPSLRPEGPIGWLRWALRTDHPTVGFVREVIASVLAVLLLGAVLFAVSGIWPPMVAVESGSMEPHMYRGDLVFVMEEHRFAPAYATGETGVVTYQAARGRDAHRKFGDYGDVIVFSANGGGATPVIHRARFWVDAGEDWYGEADPAYVSGDSCSAIPNCPAPHAGFITKGDGNGLYDQAAGISGPVRPAWIKGTAEFRVPWLGYVRLYFTELLLPGIGPTGELPGVEVTGARSDAGAASDPRVPGTAGERSRTEGVIGGGVGTAAPAA